MSVAFVKRCRNESRPQLPYAFTYSLDHVLMSGYIAVLLQINLITLVTIWPFVHLPFGLKPLIALPRPLVLHLYLISSLYLVLGFLLTLQFALGFTLHLLFHLNSDNHSQAYWCHVTLLCAWVQSPNASAATESRPRWNSASHTAFHPCWTMSAQLTSEHGPLWSQAYPMSAATSLLSFRGTSWWIPILFETNPVAGLLETFIQSSCMKYINIQ